MKSWKIVTSISETAFGDIQDLAASLAKLGIKTVAAIYEIACVIGINERRVRTLLSRDSDARISDEERRNIRNAVIEYHRHLAARHRDLAQQEDMIANTKETEKNLNQLSREISDESRSSKAAVSKTAVSIRTAA